MTHPRWLRLCCTALAVAAGCSSSHRGTGAQKSPLGSIAPASSTVPAGAATTSTMVAGRGRAVPAGFTAFAMSWISDSQGWALGTVWPGCALSPCTWVVHTLDGGRTWTGLAALPAYLPSSDGSASRSTLCNANEPCLQGIRFANAEAGYIYGQSSLWLTIDGGRSWAQRASDDTVALGIDGDRVLRVVQPGGFCTGGCLLGVEDAPVGTTSWHLFRVPALQGVGEALAAEGPDLYLQVLFDGGPSQFYRSTDSGMSWSTFADPCAAARNGNGPGQSAAATATAIGAGVTGDPGARGHLAVGCSADDPAAPAYSVVSSDAGTAFVRLGSAPLPVGSIAADQERIRDIASVSALRLVMVVTSGNSAYIAVSSDAGATWSVTATEVSVPANGSNYFNLGFEDATTGWAIVDGTTLATTDGGDHWTPVTFHS